jgi:hypothetical protein
VVNPLTRLAAYLPVADVRGLVLVSFHCRVSQAPRAGLVEETLQQLAFNRRFELERYRPEAGVVLHTFLLTKEQFGFYRRGFFFANPKRVRVAEEKGLVRTYPSDMKSFYRVVPGVFRYPSSLLHGQGEWTKTVLERSNNLVMLLHYGGLRGPAPDEEEEKELS